MAQEVRSSQSGTASFDFSSQAGVLAILKAVRASDASVSDKNELRDLIFLFANGRGDQAVRNVLEERLAALGITGGGVALATPPSAAPAAVQAGPGFAGSRPTPAFSVSASTPTPAPAAPAAPAPSASQPAAPVAAAAPVPTPSAPAQPTPAPTAPAAATVITPITPTRPAAPPAPAATPAPSAAPAVVVAAPTPAAPSPAAPAPTPTPTPSTDTKAVLDRIKMIKAEVNSRFGNPVNLVDINNAVGREYMSALLEAMKQVSTDSPIMIAESMERLETVYAQIQKIEPDQVASTPTPATSPAPAPSMPTQAAPVTPIAPTPTPVVPVPAAPVTPEPSAPVSEWSAPEPSPAVPDPAANRIEVRPIVNVNPVTATPVTPAAAPQATPAVPMSPVAPLASVAASPALHSPDELPDAASLKTASVAGDPLFTKEVDDGLDQLLSEWSLFKKSGLFGTGPKGREHPLFKKLAPLQIPLVLAGRFEGSTQEIKQSITDYMNGWRYEQGIIYEKGETFEKYLRRVIKHIIDWQNNKARS